mmetsp:Transcript_12432/g.18814  ORF Transcript_12432/g.18814 Transcript_12432/m.18814 type:complete len:211 (-) Transcript_12432:91-723(-)
MPPHGPGMSGATHSHDPEYPDDEWNLYTQLDPESTTALNCTQPSDALGIFKPSALRHDPNPTLYSDADEELMVIAKFVSPVHVRKICIIGGGSSDSQHPNVVKCYVNRDGIDFTEVQEMRPTQEFNLPINTDGSVELIPAVHPFSNIMSLAFFFPSNHGDDCTAVQYIGLQGEHTHYRREAVNTTYEVLCTGEDVQQPTNPLAGKSDHLH